MPDPLCQALKRQNPEDLVITDWKFYLPVEMLVNFYTAIIKSIPTSSITVWFAAAVTRDKAELQQQLH